MRMKQQYINANICDSMFFEQEGRYMCGTIYQVLCIQKAFREDLFESAVQLLSDKYPILHSVYKKGVLNDRWLVLEKFNVELLFSKYNLNVENEEEFFEEAYRFFSVLENKTIDICKNVPWKFFIINNDKTEQVYLVIGFHHIVADGIGWMELLKELVEKYKDLLSDVDINDDDMIQSTYNRVLVPPIDEIHLNKMIQNETKRKETLNRMKEIEVSDRYKANKKQQVNYSLFYVEKLTYEIRCIQKMIQKLSIDRKVSLNDFLVYVNCQLNFRLRQHDFISHQDTFGGFRVNNRKYMKKSDEKYLANLSYVQYVFLNENQINDDRLIFDAIDEAKEERNYLYELVSLNNIKSVPLPIFRLVNRKVMKEKQKELCKGVTTTNMGKLDSFLSDFGDTLIGAYIIPCGFSTGYPLICASSFKDKVSFVFVKYNECDIVDKVKNEFEEVIKEKIIL